MFQSGNRGVCRCFLRVERHCATRGLQHRPSDRPEYSELATRSLPKARYSRSSCPVHTTLTLLLLLPLLLVVAVAVAVVVLTAVLLAVA